MKNTTSKVILSLGLSLMLAACGESTLTSTSVDTSPIDATGFGFDDGGSEFHECSIDSTCEDGFVCRGFCLEQSTQVGALGGPCDGADACSGGLSCVDRVCVNPDQLDAYYASLPLTEEEFFGGMPEVIESTIVQELDSGVAAAGLQASVDLTQTGYLPQAGNQGQVGSCLAFAAGYGMASFFFASRSGTNISRASGNSANIMSPAFLYAAGRRTTNRCASEGMTYNEASSALEQYGIPSAATVPYDMSIVRACSLGNGVEEARQRRITQTRRLFYASNYSAPITQAIIGDSQIDSIRAQLASGRPVVLSIRTPGEMQRLRGRNSRVDLPLSPYRRPGAGVSHGYHAVLAVGYNDASRTFKIMNSWGRSWGDNGFMTVTYQAAKNMIFEAWVATGGSASPTPDPTPQPSGCQNPTLRCASNMNAVARVCSGGGVELAESCSSNQTCVEDSMGAYCVQSGGRCSGTVGTACGRSRNGSTHYVVETCNGAYLDTLEQCDGACERDSSGRPFCSGSMPEPGPQPQPSGSGLEVRLEWEANIDLDLFLTEDGGASYSYSGTRGNGQFDNESSCPNNRNYCAENVTSIERVIWRADAPPQGNLSVVIQNYDGGRSVPARIVVLRDGREVASRTFNSPSGRRERTGAIPIQLR
jgi:hypothetical protein